MKKLISILVVVCGMFCASQTMADTTTSRFGLTLPTIGSSNWGPKLNNNFSLLDPLAGQGVSNTFTSSNTFSAYNNFTGGVTMSSVTITNLTVTNSTGNTSNINVVTATTSVINNETIKNSFTSNNGSTMTVNGNLTLAGISTVTFQGNHITGTKTDDSTTTITAPITISTVTNMNGALVPNGVFPSTGMGFVAQGPTKAPIWTYMGRILQQPVSFTIVSDSSTAATSAFVNTDVAASITLVSSNSCVLVMVEGVSYNSVLGSRVVLSINRGTTNLAGVGATSSFQEYNQYVAGYAVPISMFQPDFPKAAGTFTYTVTMQGNGGVTHFGDLVTKTITLWEIGIGP